MTTITKVLDKTLFPFYSGLLGVFVRVGISGFAFDALCWLVGLPIVVEIWRATHRDELE